MAKLRKSKLFNMMKRDSDRIERICKKKLSEFPDAEKNAFIKENAEKAKKFFSTEIIPFAKKFADNPSMPLFDKIMDSIRNAVMHVLDLTYSWAANAMYGRNDMSLRNVTEDTFDSTVLTFSIALTNTAFLKMFELFGVGRNISAAIVGPLTEETAKSIALSVGKGVKFVALFGGSEFLGYVSEYAPYLGVGKMSALRAICWADHFFMLFLQYIIPNKNLGYLIAMLYHSWNNAGLPTLLDPVYDGIIKW